MISEIPLYWIKYYRLFNRLVTIMNIDTHLTSNKNHRFCCFLMTLNRYNGSLFKSIKESLNLRIERFMKVEVHTKTLRDLCLLCNAVKKFLID